ncbi:hypothetical protein JND29_14920, partial [Listeria monocytogenes]|nr:hypothetical protein [Listeria monocytogenes]
MPSDARSASAIAAANSGTGAMRTRFDTAALERWMASHIAGFAGPLRVDQFNG